MGVLPTEALAPATVLVGRVVKIEQLHIPASHRYQRNILGTYYALVVTGHTHEGPNVGGLTGGWGGGGWVGGGWVCVCVCVGGVWEMR